MFRALNEKVEAILIFGEANRNIHAAMRIFNERFPDRPICRKYLKTLVVKFQNSGSVKNAPRTGRPSIPEEKEIQVLGEMVITPQQTTKNVANTCEISQSLVKKILHKSKFHPYKMKILHQLTDNDPDKRTDFCEMMSERVTHNPDYVKHICFSDESTFFVNGNVNTQNCRYWSDENPHFFREGHTQYPEKLNVWAGILGDHIIGPIFLEENLTGPIYLDMLQNRIVPMIIETVRRNPNEFHRNVTFQQDGAPPHYYADVRHYLNATYPGQWIGRRGSTEWPARSPDLTPLDFFLWGYLKSKVYKTLPESLNDLRQRIIDGCNRITPAILANVRKEFEDRLFYCLEVNGHHFQHLLK